MQRAERIVRLLAVNVAVAVALFIVVEGLTSAILFLHGIAFHRSPPLGEASHTRYDPELGWIAMPNVFVRDMYGEGVSLRTNSQGFRNEVEVPVEVPPGKVRVLCSGDSFTLGYGVDDDHAWCRRLTALDDRVETVNLGQAGYGIDQSYLWYLRAGAGLKHDLHVFAFITEDFRRMQSRDFLGFGKPVIALRDDKLFVENVPVPRRPFYAAWLADRLRYVHWLRSMQLVRAALRKPGGRLTTEAARKDAETREVTYRIFEELAGLNAAQGSRLVLVYLPVEGDYTGEDSDAWRAYLGAESRRRGWLFIDLVEAFRRLPPTEVRELFIPEGALPYLYSAGHYTGKANEFVATQLSMELRPVIDAPVEPGLLSSAGHR